MLFAEVAEVDEVQAYAFEVTAKIMPNLYNESTMPSHPTRH